MRQTHPGSDTGESSGDPPLVSAIIPTYNRRDEVIECVESLLRSTWPRLEIVVVDNASRDGTREALDRRFGERITVVRSETNLYAGGGRNLGATQAHGGFLLFVDSDNRVDPGMVSVLVRGWRAQNGRPPGLTGPFMYYAEAPERLCWVEGDINLWTSRTWWKGVGEVDQGQYAGRASIRVGHIPNVFMTTREIWDQVGGIDPVYGMHYEESDLAERIKRAGYGVYLVPAAKTWHRIPWQKPKGDKQFAGAAPGFLYYTVRNRILFERRHASVPQRLVFQCLFAPLFLLYNVAMLIRNRQAAHIPVVWRAHRDGFRMRIEHGSRSPL